MENVKSEISLALYNLLFTIFIYGLTPKDFEF